MLSAQRSHGRCACRSRAEQVAFCDLLWLEQMVFRNMDLVGFEEEARDTRFGLNVDLDGAFHHEHGAGARLGTPRAGIHREHSLSQLSFLAIGPGTIVITVCCITYRI